MEETKDQKFPHFPETMWKKKGNGRKGGIKPKHYEVERLNLMTWKKSEVLT